MLACFILSFQLWNYGYQNLAEIGHSDEPKSLFPIFGKNQHKINASGSKENNFYIPRNENYIHLIAIINITNHAL